MKHSISTSQQFGWVRTGMRDFEKALKPSYSGSSTAQHFLQITSDESIEDEGLGIVLGRLPLTPAHIESFFRPCLQAIGESVREQLTGFVSEYILVTGGFGESPRLQKYLEDKFSSTSCKLTILNDGTSKAVSDGAVMWHCTGLVTARRVRFFCGTDTSVSYDEKNPEHRKRKPYIDRAGDKRLRGGWSQLVEKGRLIQETDEDVVEIESYSLFFTDRNEARTYLKSFEISIYICTRSIPGSGFMLDKGGDLLPGFQRVCKIRGDLSSIADSLPIQKGIRPSYVSADFEVGISFGGTQLRAFVQWDDAGSTRRTALTLIPNAVE